MIDLSHLQIELRPLTGILAYARNSRTHSDELVVAREAFGITPTLAETGETFNEVAHARDVSVEAAGDLRAVDPKSIRRKPNGMPCYAPKGRGTAVAIQ